MENLADYFKKKYVILSLVFGIVVVEILWLNVDNTGFTDNTRMCQDAVGLTEQDAVGEQQIMNVALIVCGPRYDEIILTMKSILMFTDNNIHFRIFADQINKPRFDVLPFPDDILTRFLYTIYDINLPEEQKPDIYTENIKPCCTQRLYLPDLLPDVDRILYADGDMRFFVPLGEVWSVFDKFNSIQVAAITWHNEDGHTVTYSKDNFKIPFYKPFETLFKLDCKYNYRKCYCKDKDAISCLSGLEEGPSVVHGIESSFRSKNPEAQGLYAINGFFEKYNFSLPYESQLQDLLTTLYKMTEEEEKCRKYMTAITKRLREAKI